MSVIHVISALDTQDVNYSLIEYEDFKEIYPSGNILSKEVYVYNLDGKEISITVTKFSSSQTIQRIMNGAISHSDSKGRIYFIGEDSFAWYGDDFIINIRN